MALHHQSKHQPVPANNCGITSISSASQRPEALAISPLKMQAGDPRRR